MDIRKGKGLVKCAGYTTIAQGAPREFVFLLGYHLLVACCWGAPG